MTLMQEVAAALDDASWPLTFIEGEHGFHTTVVAETGEWALSLRVIEDGRQVICYSFPELDVPADRREDIAILLTRINFGLVLGCFELDLDDGEVRYRTALDLEDTVATSALLLPMVMGNLFNVERYLPAIEGVLDGLRHDQALYDAETSWDALVDDEDGDDEGDEGDG